MSICLTEVKSNVRKLNTAVDQLTKAEQAFRNILTMLDLNHLSVKRVIAVPGPFTEAKHGRMSIFDPCFRARANTKRVLVFVFRNKYLIFNYLFAFVSPNANEYEQGQTRLK